MKVTLYKRNCECDYEEAWSVSNGISYQKWQSHAARLYNSGPHISGFEAMQVEMDIEEYNKRLNNEQAIYDMYYTDV
jgi:hypothetical protein